MSKAFARKKSAWPYPFISHEITIDRTKAKPPFRAAFVLFETRIFVKCPMFNLCYQLLLDF